MVRVKAMFVPMDGMKIYLGKTKIWIKFVVSNPVGTPSKQKRTST